VTGDHETGGMSMGFSGTGYALYMERLANQTMSVEKFDAEVAAMLRKNPDLAFDGMKPLIETAFGFRFGGGKDPMALSEAELKEIRAAFDHDKAFHKAQIEENKKYDGEKRYLLGNACRIAISHKSGIGWSSSHHTAMPVMTTAKGCGEEMFSGFIENTDIAKKLKSIL
nr:alkaline phosphatase [Kiritimatiellia bacterium]